MAPGATLGSRGTSPPPIDRDRGVDVAAKRDDTALLAQRSTGNRLVTSSAATSTPSSAKQASADLPRTIGNRRVSWTDSAAPESASRARAMDALEVLGNEDLTRLRGKVVTLTLGSFSREQQAALRKLEDIEFVAMTRGIRPMEEVPQLKSGRPYAEQRRLNVRILIEQGVRLEGSFEKAIEPHEKWREIESDIRHFRDEAKRFETEFRSHAVMTAQQMLTESQRGIGRILRSYGLPSGEAMEAADRFAKGSELAKEVERVLQIAIASEHVDDKPFKKKRVSLVNHARKLAGKQRVVQGAESFAASQTGLPGVYAIESAAGPERIQLGDAWIAAVRAHPVLAAYRRSSEAQNMVDVDLRQLATSPIEGVMRSILVELLPKLRDIRRARNLLYKGPRALDPLSLPAVVALTRKNMFIPEGSLRDGVARDLSKMAANRAEPRWLTFASFVLAIITLVPTAGMSIGIPIGAASMVLAAYSATQQWEEYSSRKDLSNTDIDLARSLWTEDPSLTWFVINLVIAGFEVVPLVREFRKARRVSRLGAGGEETQAILREAGIGAKGKGKPGPASAQEIVPRVPRADPNKVAGAVTHTKAEDVEKALGKAFSAARLEHGTDLAEANPMMRDLLAGLEYKGQPLTIHHLSSKIKMKHVRAVDGTPLNAASRKLLPQLPAVYKALRDPEFVQQVAGEVWKYAAKEGITTREALQRMLGGRVREVESRSDRAFRAAIAGDGPWVDLVLANSRHGGYVHMFQEVVVQKALAANGKSAGRRFRRLIAQAEGPLISDRTAGGKKQFWSAVWDSLFDDLYGKGPLNNSDELGELLQTHLGLPKWVPPKGRQATPAP